MIVAEKDQPSEFDPFRQFVVDFPELVQRARHNARYSAVSYRRVLVGAALAMVNPYAETLDVYDGGNIKPNKTKETICAEKMALRQARDEGLEWAAGLVTAATVSPEIIKSILGWEAPTLISCYRCASDFPADPLMRPETLVPSVGLRQDRYQVHTVDDLMRIWSNTKMREQEPIVVDGFDGWDERVDMYDSLVRAEMALGATADTRTRSELAQRAMLASL